MSRRSVTRSSRIGSQAWRSRVRSAVSRVASLPVRASARWATLSQRASHRPRSEGGGAYGGGRADGEGEARDVLGRVADDRAGPAEDAAHPPVGADHEVPAREGVVGEDHRAGLGGELGRGGRGELVQAGGVELVGVGEALRGAHGGPAQRLQGARSGPRHADALGLPERHLAQTRQQSGQIGLADGGHVVFLPRAARHLGVQRVGQPGCPLAVRHAGRHRHRDVRADEVAQAQFAALAQGGLAVGGEAQHMAGADPPGGGFGARGGGPDVGAVALLGLLAALAVLEQGADQPADGVRAGCRCLGHGRAVVVREGCGGHRWRHSTMTSSREVLFSRRPPASVTVTMSSMRTPNRPGR